MAENYSRYTLKWTCSKCSKPLSKKQFDNQKDFKSHMMIHNPPNQNIKFQLEKKPTQIKAKDKEKNLQELTKIMKEVQESNKTLVSQIQKNNQLKKKD